MMHFTDVPQHQHHRALAVLVPLALTFAQAADLHAQPLLPKGGQFVAGSGTISGNAQALIINQSSTRGVVDWRSFSIASGRSVIFRNGNGATLNRVTGGDPSVILGRLSATGSLYLINPQGVLVGPGGVITTGGRFVASTLSVGQDAFMQGGALTFSGGGNGVVVNLGQIGSSGGDVFLISRRAVVNGGSIDAPQGSVELASGQQVLLQDAADSRQVFVVAGSGGAVVNAGGIRAAQVDLQAADGNIYALAGNHAAIRASGTALRNGHVWLVAEQGTVHADGPVSAMDADGSGGIVEMFGNKLDVSGVSVRSGLWKLGAPTFTLDDVNAPALSRSLALGTSIAVEANGANGQSGDLTIASEIAWSSAASLTLSAAHNVMIASNALIRNTGRGNLTLRADANALDNGGGVTNNGAVDWSASTGMVSALYDMNGSYLPGTMLSNANWQATPYSGLRSQVTGYKLVNNVADLQSMSQNLAGTFALGTDIDASSTRVSAFAPIGVTLNTPFVGQFDGFGHTIDHFGATGSVSGRPPQYAGLFGVIGPSGVVRNVGLTDASVGGNLLGFYGALAGRNDGLVTYTFSTGNVETQAYGGSLGGLVGLNNGMIERSWSSASMGSQGLLGGLVGTSNGTIAQSYATGVVAGGTHGYGGGLVSINNGTITQSYATGGINDLTGEGALVYDNGKTGAIDESFATGAVAVGPPLAPYGGLAATNEGLIAENVYWNAQTTLRANAAGNNTGTAPPNANGLTSAQMSTPANFVSWDFSPGGAWVMPVGATHPLLNWQASRP